MLRRVVIAGGGTGGHLFPGIALAQALMKHDPDIEITFVGTRTGLEARVLPREGFRLKTISAAGLIGQRGRRRILSWLKLPWAGLQAFVFLLRYRPRLVVGVGGYVSGPVVAAATTLGIPTLIHEQNALPGVTNRLLGTRVDRIAVSFEESLACFPKHLTTVTGNLIRPAFAQAPEPRPRDPAAPLQVLVLGGSQGAHSINRALVAALPALKVVQDRVRLVHQTGQADAAWVAEAYQKLGWEAEVLPFIYDMEQRYREADLVICRAGATTLAELTACGKASVLIPYPFAAHQHQEKNARVLEAAEAAVVISNDALSGEKIAQVIRDALEHPEVWDARARAAYGLGRRDATERVKQMCLELMQRQAA